MNDREEIFNGLIEDHQIHYAKNFTIKENSKVIVIDIVGMKGGSWVLFKKKTKPYCFAPDTQCLEVPCKRIASLSSVYSNMLAELGDIHRICAVENKDYYSNPELLKKFRSAHIPELAKGAEIEIEKCLSVHPDIVFGFATANPVNAFAEKVRLSGIPVLLACDDLEDSPLARAEWIKLFSMFTGKRKEADSIFASIENKYLNLKEKCIKSPSRPTVFTEIMYGGVWYVPGGKSSAAALLKDAGAKYLWEENDKKGSLSLNFEEVFTKAKNADFWLNQAMIRSKTELLGKEKRYIHFAAYKNDRLYNNIKNLNEKGFSDYWESGILHPEKILNDLAIIFHAELRNTQAPVMNYYIKLKN